MVQPVICSTIKGEDHWYLNPIGQLHVVSLILSVQENVVKHQQNKWKNDFDKSAIVLFHQNNVKRIKISLQPLLDY